MVERGKSGWSLNVSTDFLHGLTDDLRPAEQLRRALEAATAERGGENPSAHAVCMEDGNYVGVSELASGVGDGAVVEHERVTGRIKFRRAWLARPCQRSRDSEDWTKPLRGRR